MKKKRLNRDGWGFQHFPYYQMRIDSSDFHGIVCLIKILSGKAQNWDTPLAGPVHVCGEGMTWMTLIPDGEEHIVTAMYYPDDGLSEKRRNYPAFASRHFPVSVWYVDITEGFSYDSDGVIRYTDKYLDYIFTPEGDVSVSDMDELEEAYSSGELSKEQYQSGIEEGRRVESLYCKNIRSTEARFVRIREIVEKKIADGFKPMFLYHGSRYLLDVIEPQKANGESAEESQKAVYASWALRDVFPFSLAICGYPDEDERTREFTCDKGLGHIIRGIVDPESKGYIYRLSSEQFTRIDDWQWISKETIVPLDHIELKAGDHFDKITWSDEAKKVQKEVFVTDI